MDCIPVRLLRVPLEGNRGFGTRSPATPSEARDVGCAEDLARHAASSAVSRARRRPHGSFPLCPAETARHDALPPPLWVFHSSSGFLKRPEADTRFGNIHASSNTETTASPSQCCNYPLYPTKILTPLGYSAG